MSEAAAGLLLVSSDLMLGGLANSRASEAGFDVTRCLSAAKAMERLNDQSYRVVLIELGVRDLDLPAVKATAGDAHVVGFAGHVRTDLLSEAERSGLTVVTNGQLNGQGKELLARLR